MTDPWEDVRERIKTNLGNIQRGFNLGDSAMLYPSLDEIGEDAERILADADALLAAVPFVNEIKEWAETHDELNPGDTRDWEAEALDRDRVISEWLSKAQDILAALPEHLR